MSRSRQHPVQLSYARVEPFIVCMVKLLSVPLDWECASSGKVDTDSTGAEEQVGQRGRLPDQYFGPTILFIGSEHRL